MKRLVALSVVLLGLAACEGPQRAGNSQAASADRPEAGLRVSGYARVGVSVRD